MILFKLIEKHSVSFLKGGSQMSNGLEMMIVMTPNADNTLSGWMYKMIARRAVNDGVENLDTILSLAIEHNLVYRMIAVMIEMNLNRTLKQLKIYLYDMIRFGVEDYLNQLDALRKGKSTNLNIKYMDIAFAYLKLDEYLS